MVIHFYWLQFHDLYMLNEFVVPTSNRLYRCIRNVQFPRIWNRKLNSSHREWDYLLQHKQRLFPLSANNFHRISCSPYEKRFSVYEICNAWRIKTPQLNKSWSNWKLNDFAQKVDVEIRLLCSWFILYFSAGIAAIFNIFPNSFPFFSPRKWSVAHQAKFTWEISFFNLPHYLFVIFNFDCTGFTGTPFIDNYPNYLYIKEKKTGTKYE